MCDLDLNYCGTHDPCKNNGTCSNVAPGRYKCQCPDGFAGIDCETNLSTLVGTSTTHLSAGCMLNPCLNGGTCFGFSSPLIDSAGGTPMAVDGIQLGPIDGFDDNSQSRQTQEDAALATAVGALAEPDGRGGGGGFGPVATSIGRLYACQCLPGWSGDYCQWPDPSRAGTIASEHTAGNNTQSDLETATSLGAANATAPTKTSAVSATDDLGAPSGSEADMVGRWPSSSQAIRATNNSEQAVLARSLASSSTSNDYNDNVPVMIEANSKGATSSSAEANVLPNMHQLISWVLIATTVGVLVAFLVLAWCCLVAIERNKFHFIQMNIIRSSSSATSADTNQASAPGATLVVTTTLRRMQERIRNSFRRTATRQHIKPETKLSIENVFRHPAAQVSPPSYDESKMIASDQRLAQPDDYLRHVHTHKLETALCSGVGQVKAQSHWRDAATANKDWLWLADRTDAHPSSWI